jgi:hypothetical protein
LPNRSNAVKIYKRSRYGGKPRRQIMTNFMVSGPVRKLFKFLIIAIDEILPGKPAHLL